MSELRTWRIAGIFQILPILFFLCISVFSAVATAGEVARVAKVFDGDTVLLADGRKVRYLGINTPEYQEPFYLKAKRVNEKLVLGKEVRLEFDEERADGHERLLAYVYAGDQFVNARLVEAGLAHAFFVGPSLKCNDLLLRLQAEAKQRKVGMWSSRARAKDLKITSVHPLDPAEPDLYAPYVRITNLSEGAIRLAGYALSNEEGRRYVFPDVSVEPGCTVIVAGKEGPDGVDHRGQLVVHWATQDSVWDPKEDTAFLFDPSGSLVDRFHYKGKRVTSRSR
ncbi:MAG: thermonuclease family protein [Nitrospiraceae bacterium]